MKYLFYLTTIFCLFYNTSQAKTHCLFVVGDGSFFKPQVPPRYINGIKNITRSWGSECTKKTYLISMGKSSMIYDESKNTFKKIEGIPIDDKASTENILSSLKASISELASGDEIRAYFHDHGSRTGFNTVDSVLTPEQLETLVNEMTKKNIKFKAIFNHCFSGKMNKALYENAKIGGCSISSANNNPSFSNPELSGHDNQKTFSDVVNKNHENATALDYQNLYMRSSERFLLDYKPTFLKNDFSIAACSYKYNIAPLDARLPFGFEYLSITTSGLNNYYYSLLQNFQKMNAKYEQHLHVEKNKRNLTNNANLTQGYVIKCAQDLYEHMNNRILTKLQLDLNYTKMFERKEVLYQQLLKCSDVQVDGSNCENYEEYLNITREIELIRSSLNKETPLVNTPKDKNCFKTNPTKKWSVADALNELNYLSNSLTYIQNITDKRNHYIEMHNNLMLMIKYNDQDSLNRLKRLIECENQTKF